MESAKDSDGGIGLAKPDGATAVLEDPWWEKNNIAATKIDIRADPVTKRTKSGKIVVVREKYNRGCCMITAAVLLRILGILSGAIMIFIGAWMIYKTFTTSALLKQQIGTWISTTGSYAAMGIFAVIAGVLLIIVECRTKSLMRGCLNTYILVANFLTRGLYEIAVGGLCYTSVVQQFPIMPPPTSLSLFKYLPAVLFITGGLNIVYYVAYYAHKRNKAVALQPKYIANAEEIAYGMNLYDPAQRKLEEEKKRKLAEERGEVPRPGEGITTPIPIHPQFRIPEVELDELRASYGAKKGKEPVTEDSFYNPKPPLPRIPSSGPSSH